MQTLGFHGKPWLSEIFIENFNFSLNSPGKMHLFKHFSTENCDILLIFHWNLYFSANFRGKTMVFKKKFYGTLLFLAFFPRKTVLCSIFTMDFFWENCWKPQNSTDFFLKKNIVFFGIFAKYYEFQWKIWKISQFSVEKWLIRWIFSERI